jgi:hypothetical protein
LAQNPNVKYQKGDGEIAANKKLTPEEQVRLQEPKVPKGDRPAVPTFKENPRGIAIPGKAEAKAKAVAVRKASRQPGYKPTEEDAFHIVADAINRGKLQDRKNVLTAAFDPKTGKWVIGQNVGTPTIYLQNSVDGRVKLKIW